MKSWTEAEMEAFPSGRERNITFLSHNIFTGKNLIPLTGSLGAGWGEFMSALA